MLLSMSSAHPKTPAFLVCFSPLATRQFSCILHLLIVCAIFLSVEFLSPRPAFALDPSLDVSQYAHTAWKVRDGFTPGRIFALAQTYDGYLWLGTELGLYRFDGVRAVPWQPPAGEQLPSNYITRLVVARDGTLWIGTGKGLASWKDGKLTQHPEVVGYIEDLLQGRDGTVWVTVAAPGRLCAIRGGDARCDGAGRFGTYALALYEDHTGNVWVTASTGVWRWKPGLAKQYTLPRGTVEVNSLIEIDDGVLLLATNDGLKQLAMGKIQAYALPGVSRKFRPSRFLRSSNGALWVGSTEGLWHSHEGRVDTFGFADGLSGDSVARIFEDREGTIWVATLGGLDRFREYGVRRVSRSQGLSTDDAYSIQATRDGAIWIGTSRSLNRWQNGRVTVYGKRRGLRQTGGRGERQLIIGETTTESTKSGLSGTAQSLGLDDQERLWVSTADSDFYFEGGRFIRVSGVAGGNTFAIAGDGDGKVWVSDSAGLIHLTPGEAAQPVPWSRFGEKSYAAEAFLPDRSDRGLWIGFREGGIDYVKDGQVLASYSAKDRLGNGRVNHLRFGSRGAVWAATEGGLSRIKDGHIETLTRKNGLPCDEVHWSVEDDDHAVWVYMPCGLVRVPQSELESWITDPKHPIQTNLFDTSDGVKTIGAYGGYGPHVTKSPDGQIWFVTYDGVSVIDPRHLPHNDPPPPVHIEQITADGKVYDAANGVRLPRLARYVDIDYTALSLVVPEKVHFRFKLEGQDKDWREVVNNRHVEYSNLPPKHYRFLVKACNNSGVWNEEGAALDFVIPPAWYQTNWFRSLCVAAFLALLWVLYQYRLHQLAQQFDMRLEERVGERTRIARDLHDTLLQSFQGLVFRFQAVRNHLPERPEEACEVLDSALVSADQALAEGRSAIKELRSEPLKESDMEQMLLAMGRELASSQNGRDPAPTLRVIVEGTRREKRANIREEIYRIARELLRNTYRHAHARSIEAELRYDADAFVLLVRDDGKGIDPQVLKEHGRAGHWGLRGLYERAEGMGARLDIWSEAGAGTEARLTVPGAIAYEKSGRGGRFKLFRKTRIYEHRS